MYLLRSDLFFLAGRSLPFSKWQQQSPVSLLGGGDVPFLRPKNRLVHQQHGQEVLSALNHW
jgi:hypothetical protein